jgi:hypothetical protein
MLQLKSRETKENQLITMESIPEFIAQYTEGDRPRIAFEWNGKHAGDFVDANQEFRWRVVDVCLDSPETASPRLLEHLFQADAEWSRQAWGSPQHFAQLGSTLLARGGELALTSFATSFVASFDTYAACHQISVSPELLARIILSAQEAISIVHNGPHHKAIEAALELFFKLQAGNASEGWFSLKADTDVSNISIIYPRWYHNAWKKIVSMWQRNAT